MMDAIESLAARLAACRKKNEVICLYPHLNLDGDALGSSLALYLALERLGVQVVLPLDEPIPTNLDFLPALDKITKVNGTDGSEACEDHLALLIDCHEPSRLGKRQSLCEKSSECWTLDHHIANRPLCSKDVIDPKAAGAAELIYALIRALEHLTGQTLLLRDVAFLLMTALISDTGGFVYSNTTKRTFAIASDLMDDDIDLYWIAHRLFYQSTRARLRLMGLVFSQAVFSDDGRIVIGLVSQEMMQASGATDEDLEGIINYLRDVSGVELAVVLRVQEDGVIRANLRSNSTLDVAQFARQFGGGGHPRAAGMTLENISLEEAAALIMKKAGELL
ncbi:MAG: bifunctional oligoribonuclease/PAP phosphatase NrnA [Clostridia bacterium]|nr:bifunctional oligoribonuclease/PAP phosphatase NrnA [Clostridia bacterium]